MRDVLPLAARCLRALRIRPRLRCLATPLAALFAALSAGGAAALPVAPPAGIGPNLDVMPVAATTEKTRAATRAPAAPSGPCVRAAGVWSWYGGSDATIRPDGAATQASGATATASCAGDHVTIAWSNGFTDDLTLSADGAQMTKIGGLLPIAIARKSAAAPPAEATPAAGSAPASAQAEAPAVAAAPPGAANAKTTKGGPCAKAAGRWTWPMSDGVDIRADGSVQASAAGGFATGAATCNGDQVDIQWNAFAMPAHLTLSADRSQLAGTAGFLPVTLTRLAAAAPAGATTAAAKPGKPGKPGSCARLTGVWSSFDDSLVIRPDGTAYSPDVGDCGEAATGTVTCVGQSVVIHWRLGDGRDEPFTVSEDGNQLQEAGGSYARASTEIPLGQEGPPLSAANAPGNPLLCLLPF